MTKEQQELVELSVREGAPSSRIKMALQILKDGEKQTSESDKFMSVKETCDYLAGCSRVHLWQLRKRGLPSHNIGGRLGFKRKEIDAWLTQQKEKV